MWPAGLLWQVAQEPVTALWSMVTLDHATPGLVWQSSQVLALAIWTAGLLWQLAHVPVTAA